MDNDYYCGLIRGLTGLLEDWRDWQKAYLGTRGYPAGSAGMSSGGIRSFDDLEHEVDAAVNQTIDAVINDAMILNPAQRAAVMRRYEIAAVFRFPRDNYAQCLQEAHDRLLEVLPRRGVEIPVR